ncbi:hypothetical protein M0N77_13180 [Psychrobacter sp. AH5]
MDIIVGGDDLGLWMGWGEGGGGIGEFGKDECGGILRFFRELFEYEVW